MFDALVKNTLAPLLFRLALAAIFIFHGFHKVGDEGNEMGLSWMDQMAKKQGKDSSDTSRALQAAVAWGELVGGIALAVGFLTRLAALGIIAIMAGAIATVHGPHGFNLQAGGYEYNMLIIVAGVVLVLTGPGPLAVDRVFRLRRRQQ
jgi:putative oxidoreductase